MNPPSPAWERFLSLVREWVESREPAVQNSPHCGSECLDYRRIREALAALESEAEPKAPEVEVELTADSNVLPNDGGSWTIRVYAERPVAAKASDLPKRLREKERTMGHSCYETPELLKEAATEIERLSARVRELEAAR